MEILKDFFAELKDGEPLPWLIVVMLVLFGVLLTILYFTLPEDGFSEIGPLALLAFLVGWVIAGKRGGS